VTIGPGITIVSETSGGRLGETGRDLILQAAVVSNVPGRTISLFGTVLDIQGPVTATGGGEITIDGQWTNAAGNTIAATGTQSEPGRLELQGNWINNGTITGTDTNVFFGDNNSSDSWQNLGVITLAGTPLTLDGSFATSSLGTLSSNSIVTLTGELDNTGTTLNLDTIVGNPFVLGSTGVITGGNITGSTAFTVGPNVGSAGLIDVTMNTDLVIGSATQVSIFGDLTLAGVNVFLECSNSFSFLNLNNNASLTGVGELVFNGTSTNDSSCRARPTSAIALPTIDTGITVRTGLSGGRIGEPGSPINLLGQVNSTLPGRAINILGDPVSIEGSLTATGGGELVVGGASWNSNAASTVDVTDGTLSLQGNWTNDGTITANNSIVTFGSTFSDSWNNAGTLTLTDSPLFMGGTFMLADLGLYSSNDTLWITGTLDNVSNTLDLDAVNANEILLNSAGTVDGGTITGLNTWEIGPNGGSPSLEGVILDVNLRILNSTQLNIAHSLVLNNASIELAADSSFSFLNIANGQSTTGTGSILFAGLISNDSGNRVRRSNTGTGTTSFGPDIEFRTVTTGGIIGDTNRELEILGSAICCFPIYYRTNSPFSTKLSL